MDVQQIWVSRLWHVLLPIQQEETIKERPFNEILFLLMTMHLIRDGRHSVANWLSASLREKIIKFLDDDKYGEFKNSRLMWQLQAKIYSELDIPHFVNRQFPIDDQLILRIITTLQSHSTLQTECDWLPAIDVAFYRSMERRSLANERATTPAIELAASFLPNNLRIAEYFLESGELAVRAARQTGRTVEVIGRSDGRSNESMLRLRLALHDVKVTYLSPEHVAPIDSLVLISHPTHRVDTTRSNESRYPTTSDRFPFEKPTTNSSSIAVLAQLIDELRFTLAVVTVPQADSTVGGWRQDIRRRIVQDGHLLAVVNGLASKKSDKQVSYWIVSSQPRQDDAVLFIDLTRLAQEKDESVADIMQFAARIIRRLHSFIEAYCLQLSETDRYNGLFSHEFRDDSYDVKDICRKVRGRDIEAAGWSLTVQDYVRTNQNEKPALPRLDGHFVMDVLQRPFPLRAYVIGSNGQGKSLLLAQLAEELSQQGIRSAGLSFGATDRFPFNSNGQAQNMFTYLGARTTESGISLPPTRRQLVSYILIIVSDSLRLLAFRSALKTLGFGHRLYLIPRTLKVRNGLIPDERLAQIVELAGPGAYEDSFSAPSSFALGILRQEAGNLIIPFEKLSSGEQQLITLAAKLSAKAESQSVMLVDEPELSLHVSWQRAIPPMLAELSAHLHCAMVVATHSPVLIASALEEDHCFVAANQVLRQIPSNLRPSVESVLLDDFDTYTTNTRRVHELCAGMVATTIRKLNGDLENPPSNSPITMERLEKVDLIVRASPASSTEGRELDLELIRRTRTAIAELLDQQAVSIDSTES